jgi:ligand-binding sensor domain-containing protein
LPILELQQFLCRALQIEAHEADAATALFSVVWPADTDRNARAVEVLLEARDGTLWCGTRKYLYRLERRGERLALARTETETGAGFTQMHVLDLLEDRQGSLWIGMMSAGLVRRWPDGRVRQYDYRDGLPHSDYFGPPQTDINDLFEDRQGRLWAGTRTGGFFRFHAEDKAAPFVVARYGRADGYPSDWVFRFYETAEGRFWIASNEGLVEFFPEGDAQGRRFRIYTQRNGLSFREITALAEDAGSNLWLGTNSAGAMRLARNGFVSFGAREGLLSANAIFCRCGGRPLPPRQCPPRSAP